MLTFGLRSGFLGKMSEYKEKKHSKIRGCLQLVCEANFASESDRCEAKMRAYAAHRRVFSTQQMPFYGVKAAAIPIANSP